MAVLRFAPSPTGLLHIGNARIAVLNWLLAQKVGGKLVLRVDDTDTERSQQQFIDAIHEDLDWLGIQCTHTVQQSQRTKLYTQHVCNLQTTGHLYPCYETPEELQAQRARQQSRKQPPRYEAPTPHQVAAWERADRQPHWRFRLERNAPEIWQDGVHGLITYTLNTVSDPIVVRQDGSPTFLLTGSIDDLDLEITDIVRGDDHITNTAVQRQIMRALNQASNTKITLPRFAHLPLIRGADGLVLSKRLEALSLRTLRTQGLLADALVSFLEALGTPHAPTFPTHAERVQHFSLSQYGTTSPRLDQKDLWRINTDTLRTLSHTGMQSLLTKHHPSLTNLCLSKSFWQVIRKNITSLEDIHTFHTICFAKITPVLTSEDDLPMLAHALKILPPEPWDTATWENWTAALQALTHRKGKMLFMPLRQALTGLPHGPHMADMLPYIGRERALKRLSSLLATKD